MCSKPLTLKLTGKDWPELIEWLKKVWKRTRTLSGLNEHVQNELNLNVRFTRHLAQTLELQHYFATDYHFMNYVVWDILDSNNLNPVPNHNFDGFQPDFFIPESNVAIALHNFDKDRSCPKMQRIEPFNQYKKCLEKDVRLIHVFEPIIWDFNKFNVLENLIIHACGKTKNKAYARDCDVIVEKAINLKEFFIENNIQGYRNAKTAFCLVHKKTKEILMAYAIGHAHFGKGLYDAEIARGACKLGYSVVGGASKLWKYIIDYYKNINLDGSPGCVNSIVYYVDLNYYDGRSLKMLEGQEFIQDRAGFWNFWVESKELKNREPRRHKYIMEAQSKGLLFPVPNAGVRTNVWFRNPEDPARLELLKRKNR